MRSISSGSSMLAITFRHPPQRTHCSISTPNTRCKRRAQFRRMPLGVGRSRVVARSRAPGPLPPGVIAARSLRDFAGQALLVVKIDGDVSAVLAA